MSLGFPNESRFYDAAVHAVRFSGYDGAMEAPFFVGEGALKRIQPDMPSDEAGLLNAFDLHRERIYALVKPGLLAALRSYPEKYFSVDSSMHKFPSDEWVSVDPPDSLKTLKDAAGNIQLTFAKKVETEGNLADIDLDDHKGLQHVGDVLKHKLSGKDTDPYDIHEILWFFQQLDAEYRLL